MSQTKIYVGNLPYSATNQDLEEILGSYGNITEIKLISDRETGRSRGFGFVSFEDPQVIDAIIQAASSAEGVSLQGRKLIIKIAHDNATRSGGNPNQSRSGSSQKKWR